MMAGDRRRSVRAGCILLSGLTVLWPSPANAQDEGDLELLTAVPESPAFIFLEASPTRVTRPGSVRDFGAAIISGIDEGGNLKQGVAIDATPWVYVPGLAIPLQDYRSNWLKYVLANAQLSVGTARASGDSAATELALGLRFTLIDQGDPMRSEQFADSVAAKLRRCLPPDPDVDPEEIQACADRKMRETYAQYSGARWNARRAAIGFASGARFVDSDLGQGKYAGFQSWAVGANPLSRYGQILVQLTYRDRPELGPEPDMSEFVYGGRLLGGSSSFNGFVEVVGESRSSDAPEIDENGGRWATGFEVRVASKLWISAGLGGLFSFGEDRSFVIANLRFGANKSARLDDLRQAIR